MVEKPAIFTVERIKLIPWHKMFYMVYIEPVVFLLVFAHSLSGTIMKNQVLYQSCVTIFQFNDSDCLRLGTNNVSEDINKIETQVQQYVADMFMIRTLLESIVPAICGVFIGSWSDHYGRKPLLLISMIGFSFTYVITAIICELSRYYAVNPWYYIIAAVPHSVLGGNCVFSVAAFCFISDITDLKTRPYRMIFLEALFFIGLTSGSLLSSFVYAATNATITFTISGVMVCLGTAFVALYVPESLNFTMEKKDDAAEEVKCNDLQFKCEQIRTITETLKQKESDTEKQDTKKPEPEEKQDTAKEEPNGAATASLFSYVHIKDMLTTCFKERPYYDRCIIWLVTGVMFLSIFVLDGAMTVFYLFVREKFHWTVRDFSFYETVSHMVPMFGALIGFLILRKVFSLSVVALCILAFISSVVNALIVGLAVEPWHLYVAVAAGAFKSVGGPMCRTIVSNIVPSTDLGKIFSVKNVLQSFAPFLAAPLYTYIYKQSLTTHPGLFSLVSSAFYSIALVFLIVILRLKHAHKEHYASILK